MGSEVRKQALWLSRNRAYRRLAASHESEFRAMRDEELLLLGEVPVKEFNAAPNRPVTVVEEEEMEPF
jgi:hypothetical protein